MRVFITGVSQGLGQKLAIQFLASGDNVWGISRGRPDWLDRSSFSIKNFQYNSCDVTKHDEIEETFGGMLQSGFIPDIVILCAGCAFEDILETEFSLKKMRQNFELNLFGSLAWVELFLPFFLKRGRGIFAGISSMSVYRENHSRRVGYSASKAALNKTFENLNYEYRGTGVNFVVFNMGRMQEKAAKIGVSYSEAAFSISCFLRSKRIPKIVNIPFLQYVLTKILQWIPDWPFCQYIRK